MDNSGSPARTSSPMPVARCADERDPLGEKTAGDEAEDLRRGAVEPLRVVDDADERLLLGDLGEQRQRGEPDQEPVRRGPGAPAEHRRERFAAAGRAAGRGESSIGRAELMQAAVGQLHLRLDADGPRDVPAGDPLGQIAQQRALADARLAPQDGDSAPTGERVASGAGRAPRTRFDVRGSRRTAEPDPGSLASLQAPSTLRADPRRRPRASRYQRRSSRLAGYADQGRPLPGSSTGARQRSKREGEFYTTHRRPL